MPQDQMSVIRRSGCVHSSLGPTFAPDSMAISYKTSGPKGEELAISNSTLEHLSLKPHPEALEWAWRRWNTE